MLTIIVKNQKSGNGFFKKIYEEQIATARGGPYNV
jgi:hypothetical protein